MNGFLIGRFQPFHLGHLEAIKFGLTKVENLWIGIGSSNKSIEKRNPFTADERKEMIISSLDSTISKHVKIYYIPDTNDHEKWISLVDSIIPKYDLVFSNDDFTRNIYERNDIKVISVPLKNREIFSATNVRAKLETDQNWEELVPNGTKKVLLKADVKNRLKGL